MKKLNIIITAVVAAFLLTACGEKVEVPPAAKGVIIGKNGVQPTVIPTSKFRLDPCFAYCDKLAVISAADVKVYEKGMKLFMPKDKLNVTIDIRGTATIPQDNKTIMSLLNKVSATPVQNKGYQLYLNANTVYNLYGQQAVRGIVRSILVNYTIQELMQNRTSISQKLFVAVNDKLKETKTPLIISRLEMANVQPPKIITKAQEVAAERRIEIDKEQASIKVRMLAAEGDLKVAKAERAVRRERAEAIAEENRIAAKSVTPELLKYRQLEVFQNVMPKIAKGGNLIVVPVDMAVANTAADSAVLGKVLGKHIKR